MHSMIILGAYLLLTAMSGVISARAFRLYRASDHTGIKYFWLAFLGFGLAFLAQAANMLIEGFWISTALTLAFRYASTAGLLSLVFSMQWRDFPSTRDWLRHGASLLVVLASLYDPLIFAASAALIVLYGLVQSYGHHRERATHGLQLYVIAFSLAVIAVVLLTLVNAYSNPLLNAYALGLLIIIFGLVLVGATRVGGRG